MCCGVNVLRCECAAVCDGGSRTNVLESLEHVVDEAVGDAWLGVLSGLQAGNDGKKVVDGRFGVCAAAVVVAKVPALVTVLAVGGEDERLVVPAGVGGGGGGGGGGWSGEGVAGAGVVANVGSA